VRAALVACVVALGLGACGSSGGGGGDLVPPELQKELVFVEKTIQLQPDDRAPTWTLRVPTVWELDKNLVGTSGGQSVLVNGANEPLTDEVFATNWIDPEMHNGQFQLAVTCGGACGDGVVKKAFASWREDKEVVDEEGDADDHMQITKSEGGRYYVLRAWRVKGDDRWRLCWVSVGRKYAAAYKAFAKSCADAVEHPR